MSQSKANSDSPNIRKVDGKYVEQPTFDPTEVSLCDSCGVMTHTMPDGTCGKCKASKGQQADATTSRRLNCDDGHRKCYCAGRAECHDCGMPLADDYDPAKSELDELLYDPQRYYVQDPDTGAFVEYDMNAALQLLKPKLAQREQAARLEAIDKVFEFSPHKSFNQWKPTDAFRFYERLKAYEQDLKKQLQAEDSEGGL